MGYQKVIVKRKTVCAGDLRKLITIGSRTLSATNDGKPQYVFVPLVDVYSQIDTVEGDDNFAGISVSTESVTHIFYIRHIKKFDINMKHVIKYDDSYYKVIKVRNSEEYGILDIIQCSHKGLVTLEGTEW